MMFFYVLVIHDMNMYDIDSGNKQPIPLWKDFYILCVVFFTTFVLSVLTHKKLKGWKSFSYFKNKRDRDRAQKRVNRYKQKLRNKK